jgi:hypothetical protein
LLRVGHGALFRTDGKEFKIIAFLRPCAQDPGPGQAG